MKNSKKELPKNQHKSPIKLIALVVAVLLVVTGLGVWWFQKQHSGPKLTEAQKVIRNDCVKAYSGKDSKHLCDFSALYSLAKVSYTMTYKSIDKSGGTTAITIKSDGNGNAAYTTSSGELVKYGGATYAKDPITGTWYKYSPGSNGTPAMTNPADSIKPDFVTQASKGFEYNYAGTIVCGSLTCYKYQKVDPAQAGTTVLFWFDKVNYQLQGFSSKNDTSTTTMTMSYKPVTITPPASYIDTTTT